MGSPPRVLIAAPIYRRAWILPEWFKRIENQTFDLKDIGFLFELGPDDDETHNILWEWQAKHPEVSVFDGLVRDDETHTAHPAMGRRWSATRYYRMVEFRNSLLERANVIGPERYFSLDSDILLEDERTIETLYKLTAELDIVSPLSYMKPGTLAYPSVMSWYDRPGGKALRKLSEYPMGKIFESDIVMAAVMMSKPVYQKVRYKWHRQGEDLGFSAEAHRLGYKSYCVSNIYCPHIMAESLLKPYLQYGDERSTKT